MSRLRIAVLHAIPNTSHYGYIGINYEDVIHYILRQVTVILCHRRFLAEPRIFDYMENSGLKYWWPIVVKHPDSSAKMFSKKVSVTYTPFLWYVKGPEPKILEFIEDSVESHRPDKTLHHWTQSADGRPCHIQNGYPDDVVLDPLLGTGTTAIAALKLNRRFIAKEALVD
jgi:hypothetical protein